MRLFSCQSCGHTVFFENVRCTQCNHTLAFLPDVQRVCAIEPVEGEEGVYVALNAKGKVDKKAARYRLCQNSIDHGVCNWAVSADDAEPLCQACRLNDVIPDLTDDKNLEAWRSLEAGKRRLFYTLTELGLPIESREQLPNGMQFSFMADSGETKVFTGHSEGLITININEADDPFREKLRKQLGEGYRTVLGHFRHEIGHYYWDRLIKDSPWLNAYRLRFGDETLDYQEAVNRHYNNPPPADWPQYFVSSYATMHPWEDWAETWAHYLHMVDTLGTSRTWGLVLKPRTADGKAKQGVNVRSVDFDDFEDLLAGWMPLTVALNSLNRSMGLIDPYPFVLTETVIDKLRFVHDVVEYSKSDAATQQKIATAWEQKLQSADKPTLYAGDSIPPNAPTAPAKPAEAQAAP